MHSTISSLGNRIRKAIGAQATTTALAIVAALASGLNAEILRRRNQPAGAGFLASIKSAQGLYLLTALLSLFAAVQAELERRSRKAASIFDATRQQSDVEVGR